ncbi:uncharacterized protein AMSG_07810 [Thecamonas trahens ATCC 50062]|uniref:Protein kinase domain-containing protein n=1 Tax=Thecamonas trahens ATCC 50062 TaxID=461836 RepID=A0A0L0DI11_THETB|nr:hypothetical protein AMSG_07810 [Thecamonas trahens ATCC 50062]KNC51741.1 hypothetical protein AMSG_07810 [Thecamonas trahens ATCC 50062]|eukprot:XP_013755869.1 hypothetical protein AMSG_07810 [Thecamonas trahens ATCC 50062]
MDQFHLYKEIGRGRYSTVYKSRVKGSIQYVAVKSVDKGRRAAILNEVGTLVRLHHPHILNFYNWYETTNHLWLIVEVCTGGDLASMLAHDHALPIHVVAAYGANIADALHYVHAAGFAHGHLKPSNILLKADGTLKLCDFGLATNVADPPLPRPDPSGVDDQSRGSQGHDKLVLASSEGSPNYMAPELFSALGVHSFASDLWSFGVVLFELATGAPPFAADSLHATLEAIVAGPIPALPLGTDDAAAQLAALLNGLLVRHPGARASWAAVLSSSLWGDNAPELLHLPCQPAFEAYLASLPADAAPAVDISALEAAIIVPDDEYATPRSPDAPPSAPRVSTPAAEAPHSRIALPRDDPSRRTRDAVVEFRASGPAPGAAASIASVISQTIDDHSLAVPGPASPAASPISSPRSPSGHSGADHPDPDAGPSSEPPSSLPPHLVRPLTAPSSSTPTRAPTQASPRAELPAPPDTAAGDTLPRQPLVELAPPPPRTLVNPAHVVEHLFAAVDNSVKPIVRNKKIEKLPVLDYDVALLPFEELLPRDVVALKETPGALEDFLGQVYAGLSSSDATSHHVLVYLQALSLDTDVANIVVNSSLLSLLVKAMRRTKVPHAKFNYARLMGILVRHATIIADDVAKSGIDVALCETLRNADPTLAKEAMASLGELLFYIASRDEGPPPWSLPSSALTLVVGHIKDPVGAPIAAAYAVQTLHNIGVTSAPFFAPLATLDLALALVRMLASASSTLTVAIANTLARLCRVSFTRAVEAQVSAVEASSSAGAPGTVPAHLAPRLLEKAGVNWLIGGLSSGATKVCAAMLNILVLGLLTAPPRAQLAVISTRGLLPTLLSALDHKSTDVRGKALAGLAVVASVSREGLLMCLELRLAAKLAALPPAPVEPLLCFWQGQAFAVTASAVDAVMHEVASQGRAIAARSAPSSMQIKAFKAALIPFPAVTLALESDALAAHLALVPLIRGAGLLLSLVPRASFVSASEFRTPLLDSLAALARHRDLVAGHVRDIRDAILQPLTGLLAGGDAETRFLSLRLASDLVLALAASPEEEPETAALAALLSKCILPRAPALLSDELPIPVYTLRLLDTVVETWPSLVGELVNLGLLPKLLSFFSVENKLNNVHNVKLIAALVASPAVSLASVHDAALVPSLNAILSYALANDVAAFFGPLLEVMRALLTRTINVLLTHMTVASAAEANLSELPGELPDDVFDLVASNMELVTSVGSLGRLLSSSEHAPTAAAVLQLLCKTYGPSLYPQLLKPPLLGQLVAALTAASSKHLVLNILKILGWVLDDG